MKFLPAFLLSFSLFCSEVPAYGMTCSELFSKPNQKEAIFKPTTEGYRTYVEGYRLVTIEGTDTPINKEFDSRGTFSYEVLIFDSRGNEVGQLSASNFFNSTNAKEERTRGRFSLILPEPLKKKGIGKAFVTYFVNLHNILEVRSTLSLDNFDAFLRAKEKGKTDEEAYADTPSGRIFMPLNFRLIEIKPDYELREIDYVIKR